MTQAAIEAALEEVNKNLETVTHLLKDRNTAHAQALTAYRVAYAKAFIVARDAGATVAESEQRAILATQAEMEARNLAEGVVESAREAGRNFRSQGENLRSLNANLRPLVT